MGNAPAADRSGWLPPHPAASRVAASIAVIGIATIVTALLIWGSRGFPLLPLSFARGLSLGVGALVATTHLVVGWLLASRVPRNPIGWLLIVGGLTFTMVIPIGLLIVQAHQAYRPAPTSTVMLAWLQSSFGIPTLVAVNLLAGLLFPDGRLLSRRWRWPVGMALLGSAGVAVSAAMDPTGLIWFPTLPNPFAAPAQFTTALTAARAAGLALLVASAVLLMASLAIRYRTGDARVRAQLRWILYAASMSALLFAPFLWVFYVVGRSDDLGEAFVALAELSSGAVPIAATVAILRYRLFGIDVLISRTVAYVLLMAVLGGLSTALITLSQRLFVAVTGRSSDVPLVITAFLAAAVFTPVRRSLEGLADGWTKGTRKDPAGPASGRSPTPIDLAPDPETSSRLVRGEAPSLELSETAARLIALHRLEERLVGAAGSSRSADADGAVSGSEVPVGQGRRLVVDANGRVSCPRASDLPFVACLACPHLEGIVASTGTVFCMAPQEIIGSSASLDDPYGGASRSSTDVVDPAAGGARRAVPDLPAGG